MQWSSKKSTLLVNTPKAEILGYGVRALRGRHREVRNVKRFHNPTFQGFRVWPSSWLVMDFFKLRGLPHRTHVMDVGCGWGLAGIYCAKLHNAVVIGVDIDEEVFPFLRLHADINRVEIATMMKGFSTLMDKDLEDVDVMIGADICFWEATVDPLKTLISRGLQEGVKLILIADPGRAPFERLGTYCVKNLGGVMLRSSVNHPYHINGRILKIGSLRY